MCKKDECGLFTEGKTYEVRGDDGTYCFVRDDFGGNRAVKVDQRSWTFIGNNPAVNSFEQGDIFRLPPKDEPLMAVRPYNEKGDWLFVNLYANYVVVAANFFG